MNQAISVWTLLVAYKIVVLLIGLCFAYMGYRLFLADKVASAGDLTGTAGTYSLSLKGAAPGIFFSLFGAVIIAISLLRGINYADQETPATAPASVPILIPDQPPQTNKK